MEQPLIHVVSGELLSPIESKSIELDPQFLPNDLYLLPPGTRIDRLILINPLLQDYKVTVFT